jgi:hypothetical protein
MNEMTSCVCQIDEIKFSSGQRVAHCRGMTMYVVFDPGG